MSQSEPETYLRYGSQDADTREHIFARYTKGRSGVEFFRISHKDVLKWHLVDMGIDDENALVFCLKREGGLPPIWDHVCWQTDGF